MFRLTATTLRATTVAIPILLATAIAIPSLLATSLPASAQQINVGIGFDNFHNELAPYGTWSNHPRWGEVWHPRADRDFRPYYNGHWEDTRAARGSREIDDPLARARARARARSRPGVSSGPRAEDKKQKGPVEPFDGAFGPSAPTHSE